MKIGCPAGTQQNSDEDIQNIWKGIKAVAEETKVDHRFILAIIMQVCASLKPLCTL
jgi:hypothetical protein